MHAQKSRLPFTREFNDHGYARISTGLIPHEMEDRWFIFLEDDWLFFHRSWTGICVYQIKLNKGEGHTVLEAWVNSDPDEYRPRDDRYEIARVQFLIDNLLLGKRSPFPLPANLGSDVPAGLYQHHVSGTGYPERTVLDKDEENRSERDE